LFAGSPYFKTVEEFDPSAAANYESSPAEFIYGACKLQNFNQSYHHQFEELPLWRTVEERGLKSTTKHKMSLTHKAQVTVPGTYDWWMWHQSTDDTKEMDFVVALLGGNGSICWIPITILLPIFGFCAAHPHPEHGWVYSFTPHDGFKANSRAYANTLVTCEALGLNKRDLKSARKAATDARDKAARDLKSERRAATAQDAQDAAKVKARNKVLDKLPGFRHGTITLMNKFLIDPTAKNKDEYLAAFNRYSSNCTSIGVQVLYITQDELRYPCAAMTTLGVI